ncbi:MAG: hypothetical protein RLY85_2015, partial [Bacteroidota bacterium]
MKKFLIVLICLPFYVFSQPLPSIVEKTKGLSKQEGYFPIYRDEANGKIWMEINRLDQELLYVMSLPQGLGS